MKVKIGNKVYDGSVEPVMVILTDDDKQNINNMIPECTKYCQFPDDMSEEEARKFMKIEESE